MLGRPGKTPTIPVSLEMLACWSSQGWIQPPEERSLTCQHWFPLSKLKCFSWKHTHYHPNENTQRLLLASKTKASLIGRKCGNFLLKNKNPNIKAWNVKNANVGCSYHVIIIFRITLMLLVFSKINILEPYLCHLMF